MQDAKTRWWLLGLVLSIEGVLLYQVRGPAPLGNEAPATAFSAARAVERLALLLGDQVPHPTGSVENERVRKRLVAQLQELGLDVEIHESTARVDHQYPLYNILARLPGTPDHGRPLVLATHYDSVEQGPGAADAGSCVAALLETARALQQGEPLRRPVYLLITDGEERGLKGAQAFVAEHALAQTQPFVLNFDARGTKGPSLMYETHVGNLDAVRWVSRNLPRPCFTGSAFVTVYRMMPNDSDFTAFCRAGWTGLNFAFIDGSHRYHTAEDRLENLSWRSVQHHGNNALAIARTIATNEEIVLQASEEDAVFFDLLGLWIVYMPEWWALPLAASACGVLVLCGALRLRRRSGLRAAALMLWAITLALALSAGLGWSAARGLVAAGMLPRADVAYRDAIVVGYWVLALGVVWLVEKYALRRVARADAWAAFWMIWSMGSLALAWWLPGLCYQMLVPALGAAVLAVLPLRPTLRLTLSVVVASVMLLPLANMLPVAFGARAGLMLCPVCALALCPLLPLADMAPQDE